jgi:arsenate reductase
MSVNSRDHGQGKPLAVLFLCTGNACRSQMAEGWARHLLGTSMAVYSAGLEKHGLNPLAVRVMAEAGVDISGQHSKRLGELPVTEFDYVITVCDHAREACPLFPGQAVLVHKGFEDPPRLAREAKTEEEALIHYRRVRDEIREFVRSLPESLPGKAGH